MVINGFQKLTLLDFPEKVACIVFTAGCNFRCPFCHNASLVTHIDGAPIAEKEVLSYLAKRRGLLEGVVVTGGEPLLQNGLEEFLSQIKELGYAVKLDTNGSFPDRLRALVEADLVDYVAMDIKNSRGKYALTAGVPSLDLAAIERSVSFLLEGTVPYEFRTTVANPLHTPEDIQDICRWIAGAPAYYIQNFVDSGDVIAQGMSPLSQEEISTMLQTALSCGLNAKIRG